MFLLTVCLTAINSEIDQQTQVLQNLNLELKKGPDDKFYKSKIADDDYLKLYKKWIDTGLSSLFSAMANKK